MPRLNPTVEPRVELRVRITKSLHDRLVAECGYCGCSQNALITLGLARELGARKSRRSEAANHAILAGQIDIEGKVNA
jgi:hypothetical protein